MACAVSDIIHVMDNLAPPDLAEDWDNIGLQVGDPSRPVKHIRIALDPTLETVDAACREHVDILITHHPLIFKPLKSIDFHTPFGKIIDLATRNHLAVFTAHTNLDSAIGGINDILADRIGLRKLRPLAAARAPKRYMVVVYGSHEAQKKISGKLSEIRLYSGQPNSLQTSRSTNDRTILMPVGEIAADKHSGSPRRPDHYRLEMEVVDDEIDDFIDALAGFQAQEQIWYSVISLVTGNRNTGIGRVGQLEPAMDLKSFALMIKKRLELGYLKLAGDPALMVEKAAVCTGSGSSLLKSFFKSGAQAFISGDLRYHDARDTQAANLGIIDIGHFPSEHLIVDALARRLKNRLLESDPDIRIDTCSLEKDPFKML